MRRYFTFLKVRQSTVLITGFWVLLAGLCSAAFLKQDNPSAEKARVLVNLLDYIQRDYAEAVENGKVINDHEYEEMQEFTEKSKELFRNLYETPLQAKISKADSQEFENHIDQLRASVAEKASIDQIAGITKDLKAIILEFEAFPVAPKETPSLANGKKLYLQKCAQCHGKNGKGNGPSAHFLTPAPTNFQEASPNDVSPFQAFNVIKLGIEGTSMRAFKELNEQEIWALSFYLASLPHKDKKINGDIENPDVYLKELATHSDKQLLEMLEGSAAAKKAKLRALRVMEGEK